VTIAAEGDLPERSRVAQREAELMSWLLEAAYPLWATRGIDTVRGGFHERLTMAAEATDDARRARVQPRQVFAFSRAASLDWKGSATEAVRQGLQFFLAHYRRPDGLFRTLVTAAGAVVDDRPLLYDQGFALLAFAAAEPLMRGCIDLVAEGEQLRCALFKHLKRAGPGFETGLPHAPPLLANPHMHLLEAALAWLDAGGGSQWRVLADELGELALSHFIDPATGMLHESFGEAWAPAPPGADAMVEPGHQFEWAWLLMRWGWGRVAVREAALRLIELGERCGVRGGVAINGMGDDGSPRDCVARLWPQTERLRAAALAARLQGDSRYWKMTADAAAGLIRYLATPLRGLWYDRLLPSGEFVEETVTAGNLYHIVGAICELVVLMRATPGGGLPGRSGCAA
jgi:mannose/cellobiose epimerase-like protein (N-acyl-D-glucosamine 2-epimerase family)